MAGLKRSSAPVRLGRAVAELLRMSACLAFVLFGLRHIILLPIQTGENYGALKARPLFVPCPIEAVCTYLDYIYILYADSGAVNAYDGDGAFLWAVSVPWHDHTADTQMTGRDSSLLLWQDRYTVYQYDLETGAYQGSFPAAGHADALCQPPAERLPTEQFPEGTIVYDALTVYRQTAGGALPVVARSGWVRLLFPVYSWMLGFFSLLTLFLWEHLIESRRR